MAIKIDEHAHIATFYDQETGLLWQQDRWDFNKPIEYAEGAWPTVEGAVEAFFDGKVKWPSRTLPIT